jgi:co-chaperonin GroES (HSP10)
MTHPLQPINDYILAELVIKQSKVVRPDNAAPDPSQFKAYVVSVGDKVDNVPIGKEVLFNPQAANAFEWKGNRYAVLRSSAIYAIVTEEPDNGLTTKPNQITTH